MLIPTFSYAQTVTPESAKHDKVEIKIEDGAFLGDAEQAEEFLRSLGTPPMDQRDSADLGRFGQLFSGQQGHDSQFYNQPIRSVAFSAGGRRFSPPLVGGHLEIFPSQTHENVWHLKILASLNPTRFLRHQRLPYLLRPFSLNLPPSLELNLYERTVGSSYDEEFPLCTNDQHKGDNWLPNSPSWQYYASKRSWPTQLRSCLTVCSNALLSDVIRAADTIPAAHLVGPWTYNVRQVETYWEFASLTPLGMVRALEPMLRIFSRRLVERTPYRCKVTHEEIGNSLCLKVETRTGEILKIYAKTNNRIRFEIVHKLNGGFRAPGGRHTFQTINSVFPLLDSLSGIAAQRVNQVLRHFKQNAASPTHHFTTFALVGEIQAACDNLNLATDLIEILVNNGSVVVEKGNAITSLFGNALRQLIRRRVLQNSNSRCSITPPYRRALAQMRRGGAGFLVASRKRIRV